MSSNKLTLEDILKNRLFEQILDHSTDGVNVVDEDGIILYVNKVSADYANEKPEKMVGKPISLFYPKAVLLKVLVDHHAILDKEIHYIGPKKYVVSSYPIYLDGVFKGAFSVFKDIQEIDELNKKVKYLELHIKLNEFRRDIFSVIGKDGSLHDVMLRARRTVASLGGPRHSIIIGESGTGKTMLASMIYQFAKEVGILEKKAPFIEVNCGQFTNPDIAAAEIFGTEEGAYTGSKQRKGLFEQANGGILFLDEAHALEHYQTMLLKAIESGKIRRIGGVKEIPVNVIIIAASTKNLKDELLPELYQRLAQYELSLPSLKERSLEEKEHLFLHFVEKYQDAVKELHGIDYRVDFSPEAKKAILSAEYPRNIRQMRDIINYSIDSAAPLISDIQDQQQIHTIVEVADLPFDLTGSESSAEKAFEKDELDNVAEDLIRRYVSEGLGPRKIAKKLEAIGYSLQYYQIAYFLKKLGSKK